MKSGQKRRGFTLMETVVTVGIVAAMAAVVYPQVVKQFDQAEPTRIQNDLKNLQTAIEAFIVNMSGTAPGDLDDLSNPITTAEDTSLVAVAPQAAYTTVSAWRGPYVDFALNDLVDTDELKPTAFSASILDSFVCYNALANTHGTSEGTGGATNDAPSCAAAAGQKFLALQIDGLATAATDANFLTLNALFDGAGETTPESNGRIRFDNALDIVYFLAVPLDG